MVSFHPMKITKIATVCVIVTAFSIFIYSNNREDAIKIGVVASLTGPGAYFGEQFVSGISMALNDINTGGGIHGKKIELIIEDSQTKDTVALSAAKKLVEIDHISIILGDSWNSTTLAMHPYLMEQKVILLSPHLSLNSLATDDYAFRLIPSTQTFVAPLADYAIEHNLNRVAFIRVQSLFGEEHMKSFREMFEGDERSIVADEVFNASTNDVRAELTKIKLQRPDAVFNLHLSGLPVGFLIKQAGEVGLKTQWFAAWSSENNTLLKEYGPLLEGMIYPAFYDENGSARSKDFAERVKKMQKPNDMFIALGYDTLAVISKTLETSGMSADSIKDTLERVDDFEGVSGTFSFDKNGDAIRTIFLKTVREGEFVKLL